MSSSREGSTEGWNPLRLIATLDFFGEIPFLGSIRWLQTMLGATPNPQAPPRTELRPSLALVLWGENAALTEQLRFRWQEQGRAVRSSYMAPEMGAAASDNGLVNVRAIVWAGQPGDLDSFSRCLDTLKTLPASEAVPLLDFQAAQRPQVEAVWGAVDDVVMGGVSASDLTLLDGWAQFSGKVSTANSGGFASVRTRNFEPPFDLSDWQGIRLVLRGDGQRYKVILRTSDRWDSLAYCTSVDTDTDQWIRVDCPFTAFMATFRARTQPTAPPLDPSQVTSFQLMLSKFEYDGALNPTFRPGPFQLAVRSLQGYRPVSTPLLIAIAAAPEQATQYAERLHNSGIAHRVCLQQDVASLDALFTTQGG